MAMGLFLISQATAHANILDVPDDTILINTPLFDPIVVEDSIPDFGDGKFIGINDTIPDITAGLRSGTNYKVGTPSAETTVSQLGAAVWNMAFDIPQGVGGMVPNVGLSYSSQSGNGIVGWGVSISGISCISRGLKTIYHDGAVRGVKYDAHDALFLDGQRLLLSSGTECTAGAIYVLEGNPYTTVKVISANSTTGPLSFEVTTPDGVVSHYGTDSSSRLSFVDGETTSASILGTSADRRIQTAITWNIPTLKIITLSTRRPSHTGRTHTLAQEHPTIYVSVILGYTPVLYARLSSAVCGVAYINA